MKQFDRSSGEPYEDPDDPQLPDADGEADDEMLGSLLEQTRHYLDESSCHGILTDYVRAHRLPSAYGFDNLSELVRCVLAKTTIDQLPLDTEECITWIATCISEDPLANERAERLWRSIIDRIQSQA